MSRECATFTGFAAMSSGSPALTALTIAVVGVKQGILVAVVVSVIDHLRVSYHPPTRLLKLSPAGEIVEAPVASREMALPGLIV